MSRYSGIARLLQKMAEDESVVYGIKSQSATELWRDKILERLLRPEESQRAANRLREQLLLDVSIVETHLKFINIISSKFMFMETIVENMTQVNFFITMVNFLNQNYTMHPIFFLEESCVKLQMEIQPDPNSVISQEHLDAAIKFRIEKTDASDTNKYVVVFIKK